MLWLPPIVVLTFDTDETSSDEPGGGRGRRRRATEPLRRGARSSLFWSALFVFALWLLLLFL